MVCNAGFPRTGLGACPLNVKLGFDSFQKKMRRPGIEPGSTAWKAAMLTIIPPTLTGRSEYCSTFNLIAPYDFFAAR